MSAWLETLLYTALVAASAGLLVATLAVGGVPL